MDKPVKRTDVDIGFWSNGTGWPRVYERAGLERSTTRCSVQTLCVRTEGGLKIYLSRIGAGMLLPCCHVFNLV